MPEPPRYPQAHRAAKRSLSDALRLMASRPAIVRANLRHRKWKRRTAYPLAQRIVLLGRQTRGWGSGMEDAASALLATARGRRFPTILADPPWQFQNKTGKVAPEHRRLSRYSTLTLDDIKGLPVAEISADIAHLYL